MKPSWDTDAAYNEAHVYLYSIYWDCPLFCGYFTFFFCLVWFVCFSQFAIDISIQQSHSPLVIAGGRRYFISVLWHSDQTSLVWAPSHWLPMRITKNWNSGPEVPSKPNSTLKRQHLKHLNRSSPELGHGGVMVQKKGSPQRGWSTSLCPHSHTASL